MKIRRGRNVFLNICIFVAVFGSSIVGAQISSVSLNKMCLIPLWAFLLVSGANNGLQFHRNFVSRDQLIWYVVCSISTMIGLLRYNIDTQFVGYTSALLNYLVQIIVFYIPIMILVAHYNNKKKLLDSFSRILILTCRIHMLWALAQFVLYNMFSFDLNKTVFVELLGGLGRTNWTNFLWDYGFPVLRISGLNYDGAFLGYILLLGVTFDSKKILKLAYSVTILVSMQRSALMGLILIVIYHLCIKIKKNEIKINLNKMIKSATLVVIAVVVIALAFKQVPVLNDYLNKFLARFDFFGGLDDASVSSSRHILYLPYAIKTIFEINPIVFLFGIGPRASGVAFVLNASNLKDLVLSATMYTKAWAAECDFAEVLLGTGVFGAIMYYKNCLTLYKLGDYFIKTYIVFLVVLGLMYGVSHLTLTHLLMTIFYLKAVCENKFNNSEIA